MVGGATTRVAPALSAINISNTEASKLGDAKCRTRDPDVTARSSRSSVTRFTRPRWVTATPLGRPVDPEV